MILFEAWLTGVVIWAAIGLFVGGWVNRDTFSTYDILVCILLGPLSAITLLLIKDFVNIWKQKEAYDNTKVISEDEKS